jgi:hypothetical protein
MPGPILALSGIGVILLLGCLWLLSLPIRAQAPVRLAASKARGSAQVTQLIGQPLNTARFVRGHLVSKNSNGNADLTIPIHGPLEHGTLVKWAQEDQGNWHICSLVFQASDASTTTQQTLPHAANGSSGLRRIDSPLQGVERCRAAFFERKPHTWSWLVLRSRNSRQRCCEGRHPYGAVETVAGSRVRADYLTLRKEREGWVTRQLVAGIETTSAF